MYWGLCSPAPQPSSSLFAYRFRHLCHGQVTGSPTLFHPVAFVLTFAQHFHSHTFSWLMGKFCIPFRFFYFPRTPIEEGTHVHCAASCVRFRCVYYVQLPHSVHFLSTNVCGLFGLTHGKASGGRGAQFYCRMRLTAYSVCAPFCDPPFYTHAPLLNATPLGWTL